MSAEELGREYKSQWAAEVARQERLDNAIALPVSAITGLAGVLYFITSQLTPPLGLSGLCALLALILSGVFLGVSVFRLLQSMFGYEYAHLPTPQDWEAHRNRLASDLAVILGPRTTEAELLEDVSKTYARIASENASLNDRRSGHLYNSKKYAVISLGFMVLAALTTANKSLTLSAIVKDVRMVFTSKDNAQ